jgi:hypothetical protein
MIRFSELPIDGLFLYGGRVYRKTEPFFKDKCCQAEWNALDEVDGSGILCGHIMLVEPYGEQENNSSI